MDQQLGSNIQKIKTIRLTFGILFVVFGTASILSFILLQKQRELILSLAIIIIFTLVSFYSVQLKKYSETRVIGERIEQKRASGIRRGRIIGLALGILIILFLIIYFVISLTR